MYKLCIFFLETEKCCNWSLKCSEKEWNITKMLVDYVVVIKNYVGIIIGSQKWSYKWVPKMVPPVGPPYGSRTWPHMWALYLVPVCGSNKWPYMWAPHLGSHVAPYMGSRAWSYIWVPELGPHWWAHRLTHYHFSEGFTQRQRTIIVCWYRIIILLQLQFNSTEKLTLA